MRCYTLTLLLLVASVSVQPARAADAPGVRLWEAAASNDVKEASAVLAEGFPVDSRIGTMGVTALMVASLHGHTDVVTLLLERGADVNARAGDGRSSALFFAFGERRIEIAKVLLEKGATVGVPELTMSVNLEDVDFVRKLASDKNVLNQQDAGMDGSTPLTFAIRRKKTEVAIALLEIGADPNLPQGVDGSSPLILASAIGLRNVAERLLDAGAMIDGKDYSKRTALMHALLSRHRDVFLLLLERGANPNVRDAAHTTPLVIAARQGLEPEVLELLRRDAFIDHPKVERSFELLGGDFLPLPVTALLAATEEHHYGISKILLEAGADPNFKDPEGNTPLSNAVVTLGMMDVFPNPDLVTLLLRHGADPTTRVAHGLTLRSELRRQFDGSNSIVSPEIRPGAPLTGPFKEIDDILARVGAPR